MLDPITKNGFNIVIFSLLYIILFLILIPPLIKMLDDVWGKIFYGVLVAGAVVVAFRLRSLSRNLP